MEQLDVQCQPAGLMVAVVSLGQIVNDDLDCDPLVDVI